MLDPAQDLYNVCDVQEAVLLSKALPILTALLRPSGWTPPQNPKSFQTRTPKFLSISVSVCLQGYLAHKKTPIPPRPPLRPLA